MQGSDLSPIGLFMGASLVGKAVMAVLFLASLWCWVLIVEGVISVARLHRAVRQARAGGPLAKSLSGVEWKVSIRLKSVSFRQLGSREQARKRRVRAAKIVYQPAVGGRPIELAGDAVRALGEQQLGVRDRCGHVDECMRAPRP